MQAVRAADRSGAEFSTILTELTRLDALVDRLPTARQAQARFFVGVRMAEMHLRAGDLQLAGEFGLEVRKSAQKHEVYAGSYRAILLVILWQSLAGELLDELLEQEADFFAEGGEAERAPKYLRYAIDLLRCHLRFRRDHEVLALRDLRELAERMVAELPKDDPWRIKCLGELAWYYIERKDLARAEIYLDQLPADQGRYPRALIALRRGDYATALAEGKALSQADPLYIHLVGEAEYYAGRLESALRLYREFGEVARSSLDQALALRGQADCLLGLGKRDGDRDQLEQADRLCARALELAQGSRHAEVERCGLLTLRGHVAVARQDVAAAEAFYSQALAGLDAARRATATDLFGGALFTADYMGCVLGAARIQVGSSEGHAAAFAALEVGKARAMLDWMGASTEELDLRRGALRGSVQRLSVATDLQALDRDRLVLERARRPVARDPFRTLDQDGVKALLAASPGHLFLSYWLGEEGCLLVLAEGGAGNGEVIWLGDRATALTHLSAARTAVAAPRGDPWPALDRAAEFFLPEDLHARIEHARRLVFCPDDLLTALPFEALRIEGTAIGIMQPVERAPSLTIWSRLRARKSLGDDIVLVDSVASSEELENTLGLAPLRFSGREAALIQKAYGKLQRLTGNDATLAALERALQGKKLDLLHISAHAVQNATVPTATLLLLADGATSLASLCGLSCEGALVVLSSCSSALGVAQEGEGILGILLWPFATGARAAVASIWNVNQQATADLMGQFHAARAKGADSAEAMRRARAVLAGVSNYAHPHYWAGFGVYAAGG